MGLTQTEIRRAIARYWAEGLSDAAISEALATEGARLSPGAVRDRRCRLGLVRRRPQIDPEEIRARYLAGERAPAIATALGATAGTVRTWLWRLGLTRGRGR